MRRKSFLIIIILFPLIFFQCAYQVLNINLEPVDDWKTEVFYHQGTPVAVSKLENSVLTTYVVKTPQKRYQIFLAVNNISENQFILSYENVKVIYNTSIGPIKSETLNPNEVISKKIRADNLEAGLMAMNAALGQATTTTGTVGGSQVNLTTRQSTLNQANIQSLNQQANKSISTTNNLKNSLLFKNTIFPGQGAEGLCYIKQFPGTLPDPNGPLSTMNVNIESIGVNIQCGPDYHTLTYKLPKP